MSNELNSLAKQVMTEFLEKQGNQEVAQVEALIWIGNLILEFSPKRILEVGAGIGTISSFVTKILGQSDFDLVLFERNLWCQSQLEINLSGSTFKLLTTEEELESFPEAVDLLIIDDFIASSTLLQLLRNTRPRVVFIEGHRRRQRLDVLKSLNAIGVRFFYSTMRRSKNSHKVGCVFKTETYESNLFFAVLSIYSSLVFSYCNSVRGSIPLLRRIKFRNL